VVTPDHGDSSAHRAALLLIFGRAPRAPPRLGIARVKRTDARSNFFAAIAPTQGRSVASLVRSDLLHFLDDGEPAVFVPWIDDMPHDP
jgi:hypothetical protein